MLQDTIQQDLIKFQKQKNTTAIGALRLLLARIQREQIDKGTELTETDILNLIRSQVKRHKESAESFKTGGRQESEAEELAQANILEIYLPAQISEEKLLNIIDKAISDNSWNTKDFGMAIKTLKTDLGDEVDGARLATILKSKLQ